jgi:Flp pilus assembly protein TadG
MRSVNDKRWCGRRPGKTLVFFALTLPLLLGMIGLVIDGGLLMASHRQVQNAADAAATAAAMDKFRGATDDAATTTANTFMATNGMSGVTLVLNAGSSNAINIPPQDPGNTGSPYTAAANPGNLPLNSNNYVEAIVTRSVTTMFIQLIGVNKSQQVTARAVAGFEPTSSGQGAIVLDPTVAPGLKIANNNARLLVNGAVTVNSQGGGIDQYGASVSSSLNSDAVVTGNNPIASIVATALNVVGGVDNLDAIRSYDSAFPPNYYDTSNTDRPVFARLPVAPDPLETLATPTRNNGVTDPGAGNYPAFKNGSWSTGASPGDVSVGNSDNATINPGIYRSISITGGTATLNPGIYVVGPGFSGGGNTFNINGGTVTGTGVMIYNTGSDYVSSGTPDSSDGTTRPGSVSSNFGKMTVNGGTVNLTPISDTTSPYYGVLLYQRRWNTTGISVGGNSNTVNLSGIVYAKWAQMALAGQGQYNAEFVVGSLSISGNGLVTITATGKNTGRLNQVWLVE